MKYLKYFATLLLISLFSAAALQIMADSIDDDIERLSLKKYHMPADKVLMDSILLDFESRGDTSDPRYVNLVVAKVARTYGAETAGIHKYMDFLIDNFQISTLPYKDYLASAFMKIGLEYDGDPDKKLKAKIASAKVELNYALENDSIVNIQTNSLITNLSLAKRYATIDSLLLDFSNYARERAGRNSEVYISLLKQRSFQLNSRISYTDDKDGKREPYLNMLANDSLLSSILLDKYGEKSPLYQESLRQYGYDLSKSKISGIGWEESRPYVEKGIEKLRSWVDYSSDTLDIRDYQNAIPYESLISDLTDVMLDTVTASKYVNLYVDKFRAAYGDNSEEYLNALNKTYNRVPMKESIEFIDRAIPLAASLYGKNDDRYKNWVTLKSVIHELQGDFRNAIDTYEPDQLLADISDGGNMENTLSTLNHYAESSSKYGNYIKARQYFKKGIEFAINGPVPTSLHYIYINYSGLAQDYNKYNQPDSLAAYTREIMPWIAAHPELQCRLLHTAYAYMPRPMAAALISEEVEKFPLLQQDINGVKMTYLLVDLYNFIGEYDKAESLFEKALALSSEKNPEMMRLLYREYVSMVKNDAEASLEANSRLMDYFEENVPEKEKCLDYMSALYRRANEALEVNDIAEMQKAVAIHQRMLPDFFELTTLSGQKYADIDYDLISFSNLLAFPFAAGMDDLSRIPLYAEYFHYIGEPQKATDMLKGHLNKTYQTHINVMPMYVVRNDYKDIVSQSEYFMKNMAKWAAWYDDEEINSLAYNAFLSSKQFTLTTSDNIRRIVAESGDSIMRTNFAKLRNLENEIRRKAAASEDIEALMIEKNALETAITIDANQKGNILEKLFTGWQPVAEALGDNDCAVEFSSFSERDGSDTYMALVLTPGSSPQSTVLFNSKDLKTRQYANPGTDVYEKVWLPVLNLAPEARNIYFSPSGILHTMGLEYTQIDDSLNMSDRYNMWRVSSTRELTLPHHPGLTDVAIFGGLDYETAAEANLPASQYPIPSGMSGVASGGSSNGSSSVSSDSEIERGLDELRDYLLDEDRAGVAYLPGTKSESDAIGSLLGKKHKVQHFSGAEGTELAMKSLSGRSPSALHIATHGYYMPEKSSGKKKESALMGLASNESLSKSDRDMSRSGLLLSGANATLKGSGFNPDNDGIVSSLEVSSLDLGNTGLVVLSACQTALGEISGEGVFGLQRGFKMAGAGSILMSLWKVNDKATQLLMTRFYESLLQGKSKREALKEAQTYLKNYSETTPDSDSAPSTDPSSTPDSDLISKPFSSPRYWAAFVLLDPF